MPGSTAPTAAPTPTTVEVALEAPDRTLPMPVLRHVLLGVKEALHNVARHAGAAHVAVGLSDHDGAMAICIRDDGRGFRPDAPSAGRGLASLRRRAEAADGHLDVQSAPGQGTVLTLRVPLR